MENEYRAALLIESVQEIDDSERLMAKTAVNMMKYFKSLLNVHGTAVCRSNGANVDRIFAEDAQREMHNGRPVVSSHTLKNGTIVKVLGNG